MFIQYFQFQTYTAEFLKPTFIICEVLAAEYFA